MNKMFITLIIIIIVIFIIFLEMINSRYKH